MNTSVSFTKSETNWCFSTGKVGVANLADRHALYWKVNKALPIIPWIEGIPLICLCCYLAVRMWRELLLSPSLPGTQSLCCCWASGSGWSASHSSSPGKPNNNTGEWGWTTTASSAEMRSWLSITPEISILGLCVCEYASLLWQENLVLIIYGCGFNASLLLLFNFCSEAILKISNFYIAKEAEA